MARTISSKRAGEAVLAALAQHAEARVIAGAGHAANLEQPEAFIASALAFALSHGFHSVEPMRWPSRSFHRFLVPTNGAERPRT